jgi:hypothetical protein
VYGYRYSVQVYADADAASDYTCAVPDSTISALLELRITANHRAHSGARCGTSPLDSARNVC